MKGPPDSQREGRGSPQAEDASYEAEAEEIERLFQLKLAGLRRRLRKSEIPIAVRALREEKQKALKAMKERREAARRAELQSLHKGLLPPYEPGR